MNAPQGERPTAARTGTAEGYARPVSAEGRWRLRAYAQEVAEQLLTSLAPLHALSGVALPESAAARTSRSTQVTCPESGTLQQPLVEVGDEVRAGSAVAVLEASGRMRLLTARAPGRVAAVHVPSTQRVEQGRVLLTLEPAG